MFQTPFASASCTLRQNPPYGGYGKSFYFPASLNTHEVTSCGTFSGLDPGWNSAAWKASAPDPSLRNSRNLVRMVAILESFKGFIFGRDFFALWFLKVK